MPRFTKDDAAPGRPSRDAGEDPDVVAERLLEEMRSAVGSLRARLPEAFPRWQQRRRDASYAATDGQ